MLRVVYFAELERRQLGTFDGDSLYLPNTVGIILFHTAESDLHANRSHECVYAELDIEGGGDHVGQLAGRIRCVTCSESTKRMNAGGTSISGSKELISKVCIRIKPDLEL